LSALKRLRDPQIVFADVRDHGENLGIVATTDPPAVSKFIREEDLDPDFRSGPGDLNTAVLQDTAETFPSERHLLIGTSDDHRRIASRAEWEYRSVESIAKEHAWRLQYAPPKKSSMQFDSDDWP
jgi:hypothetical protein